MKRIVAIGVLSFALLISACKKEDGVAYMTVKLTDAPAAYSNVFIDIIGVEIHVTGNNGVANGWQSLAVVAGTYDLLELQNGIDTILAPQQTIPAGNISQIRLVLGSNNYVVQNGVSIPLDVPSGSTSGLKINLHDTVTPGQTYVVLLDFDAEQSIVVNGNGTLSLKPVIKRL